MRVDLFDFDLPPERIALRPARPRDSARLLLVEGRWWTGGGLTAAETEALVGPYAPEVRTVPLTDPLYWGAPVEDERYLCVARLP